MSRETQELAFRVGIGHGIALKELLHFVTMAIALGVLNNCFSECEPIVLSTTLMSCLGTNFACVNCSYSFSMLCTFKHLFAATLPLELFFTSRRPILAKELISDLKARLWRCPLEPADSNGIEVWPRKLTSWRDPASPLTAFPQACVSSLADRRCCQGQRRLWKHAEGRWGKMNHRRHQ